METIFKIILSHPLKVIVATFLLAVPAAYYTTTLTLNSSTEIFFVEEDPGKKTYDAFVRDFGADEIQFVMLTAPLKEILNAPWFSEFRREIKAIPGVTGVYDPVEKYEDALDSEDGKINLPALQEKVSENPFEKKGAFLSFEKDYVAFAMKVGSPTPERREQIFKKTEDLVSRLPLGPGATWIAGQPALNYFLGETPKEGGKIFFPLLVLISLAVLFYLFRNVRLVLAALLLILVVEVFMAGLMGLVKGQMNVLTAIAPTILFIITLAASVHLLEHLVTNHDMKVGMKDNLLLTMKEKFSPCLFAAFTTAVGFGSLGLSHIGPIQWLGIYLFFGSLIYFIVLYTFLPALLMVLAKGGSVFPVFILSHFFKALARLAHKWRGAILFLSAIPAAYTVHKLPDISFQTNGLNYFKEESFIRKNTLALEGKGLGLTSMELAVEGKENSFKKIETLRQIDALQTELEKIDGVQKTISLASIVREANGIHNDFYDFPSAFSMDGFYKKIREKNEDLLNSFADARFSMTRISITLKTIGYEEYETIRKKVEKALAESPLSREMKISVTGQFPLILNVQKYLMETLIQSFTSTFAAMLICFFFFFRKVGFTILSIIASVFPIFCAFGLMFFMGLDFDIGNIMIASVILGIAVDNTAHFLYQLKSGASRNGVEGGVVHAYEQTGGAIFFSTLILSAGFLVFALSDFIPTRNFGVLASFSIVSALVGNMLVLPALIFTFKKTIFREVQAS